MFNGQPLGPWDLPLSGHISSRGEWESRDQKAPPGEVQGWRRT